MSCPHSSNKICKCCCISKASNFDSDLLFRQLCEDSRKCIKEYATTIKEKIVGAAAYYGGNDVKINSEYSRQVLAETLGTKLFTVRENSVSTLFDVLFVKDFELELQSDEIEFWNQMKDALDIHFTKCVNRIREQAKKGLFSCLIETNFPNFFKKTLGDQFKYSDRHHGLLVSWE